MLWGASSAKALRPPGLESLLSEEQRGVSVAAAQTAGWTAKGTPVASCGPLKGLSELAILRSILDFLFF